MGWQRRWLALGCAFLMPVCTQAAERGAGRLTLAQVLEAALDPGQRVDAARSQHAVNRAAGAVRRAEGAFDWTVGGNAGIQRIYQPASSGGFLTTDVDRYDVPTTTVYAERQLESGVRVRPGAVLSKSTDEFRADMARLNNRAFVQVDIPVDRTHGQPQDRLRVQAARAGLAAAQADAEFSRQLYLHRVVAAVWQLVGARARSSISLDHAQRAQAIAARVRSLAKAGEVALLSADEAQARAALAQVVAERDALEVMSARLELAALLAVEPDATLAAAVEFPTLLPGTGAEAARIDTLVDDALRRRADVRGQAERVDQARQQARLTEREAESRFGVTVGTDRVMLTWLVPLGEARASGTQQEAAAGIGSAETALEDARRRAAAEIRIAYERLLAAGRAAEMAIAALARVRERAQTVARLVDAGRQPPTAALDAAEQLASAGRQAIEARQLHALALAELRRASAGIPAEATEPAALARLFLTVP